MFPFCETTKIPSTNCTAMIGPSSAIKYHFLPLIAYILDILQYICSNYCRLMRSITLEPAQFQLAVLQEWSESTQIQHNVHIYNINQY